MDKPEDIFSTDRLDGTLRDAVVLAGFCSEEPVLRGAADLPVRGLLLSSMAASLIPLATSLPFPVLVLEGFGLLPLNSAAFRLLASNEGREIALIAEPRQRYGQARPELFIPLPVTEAPPEPREATLFARGQRVRSLRARCSQVGVITSLQPEEETLPSGIRARAASVRLENGRQVVLPLANLEVLE
jgi:hypothetical protein